MAKIIGTLVSGFGERVSSASGSISLEWEEIVGADGKSKAGYTTGDIANALVHADDTVEILGVGVTDGSIGEGGDVVLTRKARIGWGSHEEVQSLSYKPNDGLSFSWFGNAGSAPVVSGRSVKMTGGQMPCLADVQYPVKFTSYPVTLPGVTLKGDERWPVRFYVYYQEEVADESVA